MRYQLPNGNIIYMSLEEYLSLTDDELNAIAHSLPGEPPSYKMYYGNKVSKDDEIYYDDLDYNSKDEETTNKNPIDLNNLPENLNL
jgi:hypothetical protein